MPTRLVFRCEFCGVRARPADPGEPRASAPSLPLRRVRRRGARELARLARARHLLPTRVRVRRSPRRAEGIRPPALRDDRRTPGRCAPIRACRRTMRARPAGARGQPRCRSGGLPYGRDAPEYGRVLACRAGQFEERSAMCLAIPGQVLEVVDEENRLAKVDVAGVRRNVNIGLLDGRTAASARRLGPDPRRLRDLQGRRGGGERDPQAARGDGRRLRAGARGAEGERDRVRHGG